MQTMRGYNGNNLIVAPFLRAFFSRLFFAPFFRAFFSRLFFAPFFLVVFFKILFSQLWMFTTLDEHIKLVRQH